MEDGDIRDRPDSRDSRDRRDGDVSLGDRLVTHRRPVAFTLGVAVYVAVVVFVASAPAETNYTTHTVRYIVLVALFYTFLSGVNVVHGYAVSRSLHEDGSDLAGGVAATVGLGVFYAEVIETGANAGAEGASVAVLAFVTVATVGGMLLILKF